MVVVKKVHESSVYINIFEVELLKQEAWRGAVFLHIIKRKRSR